MIEDKIRLGNLFDFYEELLTEKQRTYFTRNYLMDYSLAEIAEEFHVSRNAVFDQIKITIHLLEEYESKLHLYENDQRRNEIYDELELDEKNPLVTELRNIR